VTTPLDLVRRRVAALEGVVTRPSQFGHPEGFWVGSKEVGHIEGDDVFEIRLTKAGIRQHRAELVAEPAVKLRKHTSDWLEIVVDSPAAADLAVRLFADAVARYRD
jgi:hypothetical protein